MAHEELNEGHTSRRECRSKYENLNLCDSDDEYEVEVEVDLEGELVCALEEIKRLIKGKQKV